MHRLGIRQPEVAVVSDDLIKTAACSFSDPANIDAVDEAVEEVDFLKLKSLTLSFQRLFKIENLTTLRSIVQLQLDNNVIEEIEGLDHLVHLKWLDLSFNNIARISGLDALEELEDLSLYSNNISKLENLDKLTKLQVLSIGKNNLPNTEGLLYLKDFENLRVLNLTGNPLCSDPEYRLYVIAHLDQLRYLDYTLIDGGELAQAREQYQDELEEMKEARAIEDAVAARDMEQQKYTAILHNANVLIIETLFTEMFREDTELVKIEVLPGLSSLVDDYREKVKAAAEDVKMALLEKHQVLAGHVDAFNSKYHELQTQSQQASIIAMDEYRQTVKPMLRSLASGNKEGEKTFDGIQVLIQKLHKELLGIESDLIESAQSLIQGLESVVDSTGSEARDIATEHFRAVEALENAFFENVNQLASSLLERITTDDGDDEDYISDECRALLHDREALAAALGGSHDIHVGKLLGQEDAHRERGLAQAAELMEGIKNREWERGRQRVAEILILREKHEEEVDHKRREHDQGENND